MLERINYVHPHTHTHIHTHTHTHTHTQIILYNSYIFSGVFLAVLFSIILMLLTTITFLLGGSLEKICESVTDLSIFSEVNTHIHTHAQARTHKPAHALIRKCTHLKRSLKILGHIMSVR